MKNEKKIKEVKTYTVKLTVYKDNTSMLERDNTGYLPHEILGLLEISRFDVMEQIKGNIKPDYIERKVIKEVD